jgi:hypothetical protein
LAGIQAVDLNEVIPLDDPRPEGIQNPTPQTAPSAATPRNNAYMPVGETGAAQFTADHPTWDGRGVVVGIIDSGVTLDHPSLLTTSTGERKVIDWVTFTDPFIDDDPTWVDMSAQVAGSSFTFNANIYTAPANGSYRIGIFNERDTRLGGEVGSDVNRDGNPPGSSGLFAVLWSGSNVWVDTNQNKSFADEMAMQDYKTDYDVNYFGVDNPATDVAERMPFVVQTDGKNKVVNIGIVSGAHGSHVAGIVAANAMFGGAMSGAAPGAKLVSVRVCLFISGCTASALLEGMIYAAKQANVDVINMSIGGLPSLNDGNNARAELYNRLIEQSNVQMFISAGNSGPGMNTVGDPSVASLVLSVGSSVSQETWRKNYGSDSAFVDNLHYFSSRGPREDGGFKPQIVAPGSAVSTTPIWQAGGPVPGTYTLPPGYAMFNGTSMASPQAAQIRQALISSTRLLDPTRYQVYEQGNGIIDVNAAWNLLKTNIKLTGIRSLVPVNTLLSGFLATPGIGQGINDREGVQAGVAYQRTYTFVRTTGGSKPINFNLTWVGNDGTFSSAGTLALGLNNPVQLPVNINPATTGAHSAILNLDDPATAGIDYQTMNVVVAAERFTSAGDFTVVKTGTIGRNQTKSFFFYVPPGTPAFKVDFSGPSATPGAGQARFLRFHPYGVGIESNASTSCFIPSAGSCATSASSRVSSNPQPGVWEVTIDARRTSDAADTAFTLTASILGAVVAPNPDTIASATIGVPIGRSYTITNLYGAFTGNAVGSTLGSAFRATPTIANLGQNVITFTVAPGSTNLRVAIGSTSDPAADLDLYVFYCNPSCNQVGQAADGDSEEAVSFNSPAAGNWAALVDGYSVPAGTTSYTYVDVFVNSAFGSVAVTDASALRPAGSSWNVPAAVTVNAAPAPGRVLQGTVTVVAGAVLVGSGEVVVTSIAP